MANKSLAAQAEIDSPPSPFRYRVSRGPLKGAIVYRTAITKAGSFVCELGEHFGVAYDAGDKVQLEPHEVEVLPG